MPCWEDEFKPRKPETPPKPKTLRRGRATQIRTVPENQGTDRLANQNRNKSNEAQPRRTQEKPKG
ncbi:hypothetical protein Bca52824_011608 [Brassica carinata]|uniref:Uncharacterized protein n=1 Tax=Brassica carinata TaxID=52824 RepID=A0A8X7VWN7_BRACI|nr:hypothetical protein Bca52824_011608 [Brassica carinata]